MQCFAFLVVSAEIEVLLLIIFCLLADVKRLSAVYDASRSKLIENETHSQVGFVVRSLNLCNRGLFLCLHSLIQTPSLRQLCKPQT